MQRQVTALNLIRLNFTVMFWSKKVQLNKESHFMDH